MLYGWPGGVGDDTVQSTCSTSTTKYSVLNGWDVVAIVQVAITLYVVGMSTTTVLFVSAQRRSTAGPDILATGF